MDIAGLKPNTRTIEIIHPGYGDKIGIRVFLQSYDSDAVSRVRRRITDQRLKLVAKGKNFTEEELTANQQDMSFAAMTGWEWYEQPEVTNEKGEVLKPAVAQPNYNGEVPEFNRKNAFDIFKELSWFHDQIANEMADVESFFQT